MSHAKFLTRCLQLATYANGRTAPNPMVGAVIVHDGVIIGEGYHQNAGDPHAEVMAINSVENKSLLPSSTLYCSLEPCAHFGKTPPCSLLITNSRIPRVVVGCSDSNKLVNGKGVEHLKSHGVEVVFSEYPTLFRQLNRVFFCNKDLNRPYVTAKWALDPDSCGNIGQTISISVIDIEIPSSLHAANISSWSTTPSPLASNVRSTLFASWPFLLMARMISMHMDEKATPTEDRLFKLIVLLPLIGASPLCSKPPRLVLLSFIGTKNLVLPASSNKSPSRSVRTAVNCSGDRRRGEQMTPLKFARDPVKP